MMKHKKEKLPTKDQEMEILNRWEVEFVRSVEAGIV